MLYVQMSEYIVCETKINDTAILIESLVDIGVNIEHIEEHEVPQPLYGYQGDQRQQKAHIIIRRKNITNVSNDIGFERQKDGNYKIFVSNFDKKSSKLGRKIQEGRLVQSYSKRMVDKVISKTRGWKIKSSEKQKDRIKIRIKIT